MVLFSIVLFELGCSVIELAPEIKILGDYICGLGANFLKSFLFGTVLEDFLLGDIFFHSIQRILSSPFPVLLFTHVRNCTFFVDLGFAEPRKVQRIV